MLELGGGKLEMEDNASESPRFNVYVIFLEQLAYGGGKLSGRVQHLVRGVLDLWRNCWRLPRPAGQAE